MASAESRLTVAACFILVAVATPGGVTAQSTPAEERPPSPATSYLYGAGLGIGGFLVGGLIGGVLATDCTGHDQCELEAAFYGAAIGGTLGMATGVHLGNDRRGLLWLDMLTGAAIWGVGYAIAAGSGWDSTVTTITFIAIPITQLVSTVAVERAAGRARDPDRDVTISVGPDLRGGASLFASLKF